MKCCDRPPWAVSHPSIGKMGYGCLACGKVFPLAQFDNDSDRKVMFSVWKRQAKELTTEERDVYYKPDLSKIGPSLEEVEAKKGRIIVIRRCPGGYKANRGLKRCKRSKDKK